MEKLYAEVRATEEYRSAISVIKHAAKSGKDYAKFQMRKDAGKVGGLLCTLQADGFSVCEKMDAVGENGIVITINWEYHYK
jgi:hypothetical protein